MICRMQSSTIFGFVDKQFQKAETSHEELQDTVFDCLFHMVHSGFNIVPKTFRLLVIARIIEATQKLPKIIRSYPVRTSLDQGVEPPILT